MTVEELGTVLNLDLTCRKYQWGWAASFNHCEVKHGGILSSSYGKGDTPNHAIQDYVEKIRGQLLVKNAMGPDRVEFTIPETLTVGANSVQTESEQSHTDVSEQ